MLGHRTRSAGSARRALLRALVAAWMSVGLAHSAAAQLEPEAATERVHVRFSERLALAPARALLPAELLASAAWMEPLFTLEAADLAALRSAQPDLPDLQLWYEIQLRPGSDPAAFLAALRALPGVATAELAALPVPAPALTPDFSGRQGYLRAAPGGLDADFSSTLPGGNGAGITIYDVEYGWNQQHEDLAAAAAATPLVEAGDSGVDPFPGDDHGTAVLGELVGTRNGRGVTGVSWGSQVALVPANTALLGYNPANAILLASAQAAAGDVILIEQQYPVCDLGTTRYGPLEGLQSAFDAIQTAVANGIVVVEAAGNGRVNLDGPSCRGLFDRTTRDSGAILVGAGGVPGLRDRERLDFSSFGSRVNVQGWGTGVTTTGEGSSYRDPDAPLDANRWYQSDFGGTSSASPLVAGAAANLQGIALQRFGVPLPPLELRSLLRETGRPQLGNTAEPIGPRPDLAAAIEKLVGARLDVFFLVNLSGAMSDDLAFFQREAPDLLAAIEALYPNVRFGLGSFEDYPIAPFGAAYAGARAYTRLVDLTPDSAAVLAAIAELRTRSGGDVPQSQLTALLQAASGIGQDLSGAGFPDASLPAGRQASFRADATQLFLLWTAAPFHRSGDAGPLPYPGPTVEQAAAAVTALASARVLGISSGLDAVADLQAIAAATGALAPPGGVDCDGDGTPEIAEGEPLVCSTPSSGAGIGVAIAASVEAAVAAQTPSALCRDVTTATAPGTCSAPASVNAGSFDPDGGPLALQQTPAGPYRVGDAAVTLAATDATGLRDSCTARIAVRDQEPPLASCNAPAEIFLRSAPISFTASVQDGCSAQVEVTDFSCIRPRGSASRCRIKRTGRTLAILAPGPRGGRIRWGLSATDTSGNVSRTSCEVAVVNRPPTCDAAVVKPQRLWPVKQALRAVSISGILDPDGDKPRVTITSLFQDEPVGETEPPPKRPRPDARGLGATRARLRAARAPQGDGRVYHVGFTADDRHGGTCRGEVRVCVPDRLDGDCGDGGALYDSTESGPHP